MKPVQSCGKGDKRLELICEVEVIARGFLPCLVSKIISFAVCGLLGVLMFGD